MFTLCWGKRLHFLILHSFFKFSVFVKKINDQHINQKLDWISLKGEIYLRLVVLLKCMYCVWMLNTGTEGQLLSGNQKKVSKIFLLGFKDGGS